MSLQVWLPFIENTNNQGVSSLNAFSYSTLAQQTDGKLGKCYSGQGVYHLENDFLSNEWSLCAWVKSANWSQYNDIILCKNTSASDNCQFYFSIIKGATLNFAVNAGSSGLTFNYTFATNTWYHVAATYNGSEYALYINGEQKKKQTVSTTAKTGMNNLGINCRSANAAGTSQTGDGGKKLNDVRIYDHCLSAAEVREIAQGLVLHYKLDGFNNASILPTQYQQLEYIESTGTSYFDTGYKFDITNDEFKVIFKGNNTSNNGMIFASSSAPYIWLYYYSGNGIRIYADNGSNGQQGITGITSDLNQHTAEFKNKTYYIDGSNKGTLSNTYGNTRNNIWLFSYGGNGYPFKGRIYYVEIKNNGTYKRIFIPAKRLSDAAVGMYDLITQTFYTSSNTAFTAGAAVGTLTIQDSSGYNHNGTINSEPMISSETARYNSSISFDGIDDCIIVPYNNICPENIFTFNLWFKKDTLGSKNYETLFGGPSGFEMDTRAGSATTLSLYMASTRSSKRNLVTELTLGNWYMITMTRDGTKEKYYVNGIFQSEIDAKAMPTGTYRIGAWSSNTSQNYYGLISDFRIYCTALDADAIRQLYEVGAKIDNKANFHTFEISENNTNKLTKTGVMYDNMEESILTLPDGSCWQLLMFHYVDGGNNLFTSSNATNCNDFGLFSRLKDIDNFKIGTQYEFYGIQDGNAYRWIQTNAPLTTTAVTGFSAVSGYTSPGAGLCKCNGNTVLARTNTTSNWWNAVGCYTKYGSGIPGYAQTLCTRYMALYARIEKADVKISNQTLNASEIIEL